MKPDEAPLLPSLNDAADPALRAAIADLRGNQPDIAQLASLASRLALQGVAVTAPAAGAGAAAGKLWKKLALAGGGAASGVALWWLSSASPVEAPVPVPSRQASSTSAVATPARARSERSTAVGVFVDRSHAEFAAARSGDVRKGDGIRFSDQFSGRKTPRHGFDGGRNRNARRNL